MPFTLCSPVKPSALCEWETRQIGHMKGSANWRRQPAGWWRSGGVLGRTFCKFAEGGRYTGPDDPGGRNSANLPVSGWWAGKAQELPIGMVPAVVSRQPSSDGVPERCKFASLRLLPEIRPWAEFVGMGTDQQICVTVCCRRCRLGGCAKLRILDLLASG